MCIWVDPNEGLRQAARQIQEAFEGTILGYPGDGLGGDGGFIVLAGHAFQRNVQDGQIRILDGCRGPETYRLWLRAWQESMRLREVKQQRGRQEFRISKKQTI